MSLTRQQVADAIEAAVAEAFSKVFTDIVNSVCEQLNIPADAEATAQQADEKVDDAGKEKLVPGGFMAEPDPTAEERYQEAAEMVKEALGQPEADPDAAEPTPVPEVPKVLEAAAEAPLDPAGHTSGEAPAASY